MTESDIYLLKVTLYNLQIIDQKEVNLEKQTTEEAVLVILVYE